MRVTFTGTLQGSTCLKFDGDGSGVVKLTIPASELPQVAKLLAYCEQPLTISIQPQEAQ